MKTKWNYLVFGLLAIWILILFGSGIANAEPSAEVLRELNEIAQEEMECRNSWTFPAMQALNRCTKAYGEGSTNGLDKPMLQSCVQDVSDNLAEKKQACRDAAFDKVDALEVEEETPAEKCNSVLYECG